MTNKDKIKFSLLYCSEKRCDECFYSRWVRDVCQTHLCKDALKIINQLEKPTTPKMEQLAIDI